MTRFLLIRHAMIETAGKTLAGRSAGVHLNAVGRAQAQALAQRLASVALAAVYSSPLERALETAEPIAARCGLEVMPCADFSEIEFGEWSNRTIAELEDDPRFQRFNAFRSCAPVPGGEYMLQAQARMIIGMESLRARHPGATVAVIGHGDPIRAAVAYYAGIPLDLFQRLAIDPASTSIVEVDNSGVRIVAINGLEDVPAVP